MRQHARVKFPRSLRAAYSAFAALFIWMEKENSVHMGKYIESDEFVYILSGEKEETMKAYKRLIAGTAAAVRKRSR